MKMIKIFLCGLVIIVLILCNDVKASEIENRFGSIQQATDYLENNTWVEISCNGIPETLSNFKIQRFHNGLVIDIQSKNASLTYREYKLDPNGHRLGGPIRKIENIDEPIFWSDSHSERGYSNWIDIVGITNQRVFEIHCRYKDGMKKVAEKEAISIAKIAFSELKSR